MFVVTAINDRYTEFFLENDPDAGPSFYQAKPWSRPIQYITVEAAQDAIDKILSARDNTYTNGDSWPDRALHQGLELSNAKRSGTLKIYIKEMKFAAVQEPVTFTWPRKAAAPTQFSGL